MIDGRTDPHGTYGIGLGRTKYYYDNAELRAIGQEQGKVILNAIVPIQDFYDCLDHSASACAKVGMAFTPGKLTKLGRLAHDLERAEDVAKAAETAASALPKLTGSIAESFEGGTYATRTFKAGTEFYRAEGWGASAPGRFLGTEAVSTRAEAEAAYNIAKWGNPSQVMRTYRLTEDVTMYYGRVAGGEGYQALIPRGVDPGAVLRQVGARPLG